MWGHTLQDLFDPMLSMRKPFSILRCLSMWKPAGRNWGYDLITSGFMRFSNEQLEYGDLSDRLLPRLDQLHFPKFLRGRLLDEGDVGQKVAWETFIKESVDNTYKFLTEVTLGVHGLYSLLVVIVAICFAIRGGGSSRVITRAVSRMLISHCLLISIAMFALHRVRTSDWGHKVLSGQMLMRPFPPVSILSSQEIASISRGPTTLPLRNDILIGSRFNAKFLGSYDRWLDYHPGNVLFRRAVADTAQLYASINNDEPQQWDAATRRSLSRQLIQHVHTIATESTRDGRFLQQDFRTGDWRIMTESEVLDAVHDELIASGLPAVGVVRKEIDYMIAEYRFGVHRGTSMAKLGQIRLGNFKRKLLGSRIGGEKDEDEETPKNVATSYWRCLRSPLSEMRDMKDLTSRPNGRSTTPWDSRPEYPVGAAVLMYYPDDGLYYSGTVAGVFDANGEERYDVAFDDGSFEVDVPPRLLQLRRPITEGLPVEGCFDAPVMTDCYPGTILRVKPSGVIAILFEDGDVEWSMVRASVCIRPG